MTATGPFASILLSVLLMLGSSLLKADQLHIAVASNFTHAIKSLAKNFEEKTGHKVVLSFGSTGKLYAQIIHGAPYDVFFAADSERPVLLEKNGQALPGSRFTYATGKLVLWSPQQQLVDTEGKILNRQDFRHLAIANPDLAPYGKAARQILQHEGLWPTLQTRLVRGENIGQAYQFVKSGNAELGFVALAQVNYPGHPATGSWWEIPESLYSPIEQQAVLLKDSPAASDFLQYVKNDASRALIRSYGYGTP